MKLYEIFSPPSSSLENVQYDPGTYWSYKFKVGESLFGVNFSLLQTKSVFHTDNDPFTMLSNQSKDIDHLGIYNLSFAAINNDEDTPPRYDLTGLGNAALILQRVYECVVHFFHTRSDCKGIAFSAYEPSRIKLYSVISNKIAKDQHLVRLVLNDSREKWFIIGSQNSVKKLAKIVQPNKKLLTKNIFTEVFASVPNALSAEIKYDPQAHYWYYQFKVGDVKYGVRTEPQISIPQSFTDRLLWFYEASFAAQHSKDEESYHITGTGQAAKVLNLVVQCLKHTYETKEDCAGFIFDANDPSKLKLYPEMAKKLGKPYGFSLYQKGKMVAVGEPLYLKRLQEKINKKSPT